MSESNEEKMERVVMMATGKGGTWDLSPNDVAALRYVLSLSQPAPAASGDGDRIEALEAKCALLSASLRRQDAEVELLRELEATARHYFAAGSDEYGVGKFRHDAEGILHRLDAARWGKP